MCYVVVLLCRCVIASLCCELICGGVGHQFRGGAVLILWTAMRCLSVSRGLARFDFGAGQFGDL